MTSIMQLPAVITVLFISTSFAVNAKSKSFIHKSARFKRQFGENGDPSLQQSLQNLQNTQQQQPNLRPWQQGQNRNGFGGQFGQFGQQGSQWNQKQGFGGQGGQNFQLQLESTIKKREWADKIEECTRFCPETLSEWNPVCGTNNITYRNLPTMRCAQKCGRVVAFVYKGSCVATP